MESKTTLKEIFQGSLMKLGIKEIYPASGLTKEITSLHVQRYNRHTLSSTKKLTPAIKIITPKLFYQICVADEHDCRQILPSLFQQNIIFILIASTSSIPAFLKNYVKGNNIFVAASMFDEHYLASQLKNLIREKISGVKSYHGVILETQGKGILIIGPSGIGKTTAALQFIKNNDYWVADDLVEVKKYPGKKLIARGHKKINNLVHNRKNGIIPVRSIIDSANIKKQTNLAAIIEIGRADINECLYSLGKKKVLNVKLPFLHIDIPSGSYFDENLLKKAVKRLMQDR
jgi:serine kinase of HPr protein (carbohydrate metabolism regulator)